MTRRSSTAAPPVHSLPTGTPVRIIGGPFDGQRATFQALHANGWSYVQREQDGHTSLVRQVEAL